MNSQKIIGWCDRMAVRAVLACGSACLPLLSSGDLVHRWSFNDGTARDSVGTAHGTLYGAATIADGQLVLNGKDAATRMQTSAFGQALGADKTLVAWFTLNEPTDGGAAGGPLSVENQNGQWTVFDAIAYGERTGRQWMNGSDMWYRTPENNGGTLETAESTNEIMVAMVFDASSGNQVRIYRNGALYAQHVPAFLVSFDANAVALFGPRVSWEDGEAWGYLNGKVNEARVYNTALSAAQIAGLQAEGPNPTTDFVAAQLRHRWSFDDGTANDSVGTANGTLLGAASIADGQLHIPGSGKFVTSPIGQPIGAKTLVSWTTLPDPGTSTMGSALTLESDDTAGNTFDGIVYGELSAGHWMAGSDGWNRTQYPQTYGFAETLTSEVMLAITYKTDNSISVYRNGVLYGSYSKNTLINYDANALVQIGPRHANNANVYNGFINEARIYASALSDNQIAALYAQGPESIRFWSTNVWTQAAGGSWNQGSNWSSLFVAEGDSQTADFGALSLAADTTVALNASRTIGKLVFGDPAGAHDWYLSPGAGGTLTLSANGSRPEIAVSNRSLTVSVPLSGTNGFVKTGAGTLNLASVNTYQGPTVVAAGTLNVLPLPLGVVACYGFDDEANLGLDSSSRGNTLATSAGAPQYSADGKFGGALYLDGSSLLRTASGLFPAGVPTGTSPYTVSAFVKATPWCGLNGGWIGYGNNASNRCNCFRLNASFGGVWNYWYYNDMEGTLPSGSFNSEWHSVVGTWDGTQKLLYLDGEKRAINLPAPKIDVGTDDFVIGKTTADANFTGWIDEVVIANRALCPEEVATFNAVGFRNCTRLPSATELKVAAGAALNLNGVAQTVAGLSGAGSVLNGSPLTVTGTIAPGDSDTAPGTLSVGSNLTVSANAVLTYHYAATASDSVAVSGALTLAGTNTVQLSAVLSAAPPLRVTLFTCASLNGAQNLKNWTVQGAGLASKDVRLRSDASSVYVTISPRGTMLVIF